MTISRLVSTDCMSVLLDWTTGRRFNPDLTGSTQHQFLVSYAVCVVTERETLINYLLPPTEVLIPKLTFYENRLMCRS